MPTQLVDVIQPDAFTAYLVQNSLLSTALYQSGVAIPNGEMEAQLSAGAEFFTVPYWNDLPDIEADIEVLAMSPSNRSAATAWPVAEVN